MLDKYKLLNMSSSENKDIIIIIIIIIISPVIIFHFMKLCFLTFFYENIKQLIQNSTFATICDFAYNYNQ